MAVNPEYFFQIARQQTGENNMDFLPVNRPSHNLVFQSSPLKKENNPSYFLKIHLEESTGLSELPYRRATREVIATQTVQTRLGISPAITRFLGNDVFGSSAILFSEVPGVPFDSLINSPDHLPHDITKDIAYQSGIYLRQIHTITSTNFGNIAPEDPKTDKWSDYFTQEVNRHLRVALLRRLINKSQADWFIDRLSSPLVQKLNSSAVLCHGDYTPQNIMIDPNTNKITGIIDFELAKHLVPGWDLAKTSAWYLSQFNHPDLMKSFLDGYVSTGQSTLTDTIDELNFYKPYEQLFFWVWGWERPSLKKIVREDINKMFSKIS